MEQVFGVTTSALEAALGEVIGFRTADDSLQAVSRRLEVLGEFRTRSKIEDDPSFQQLIPYVALTCSGSVLLLERLEKGGEKRLHGKTSIGVGGHVNPEPPGEDPLLIRGLRREVEEEVVIDLDQADPPELLGFIRDRSTDVGSVHFGLACRIEVPERVVIRETENLVGRWIPTGDLTLFSEKMETWSRFLSPTIHAVVHGSLALE